MRLDLWLMSLSKWSYYVWACEVESQTDIEWAEGMKCGYCKNAMERESNCTICKLYHKRLCGHGPGDAYHRTVNTDLEWPIRRRAARKMLRAILADAPREFRNV